jgi:hypothetical protein
MDIFADAMSNLGLVDQMPPLPKCVERAFGIYSRGVTPILSPSLVTPPGEESLEEADRLLGIREPGQTFHRIALRAFAEPEIISEPSKVEGCCSEVSLVPEILRIIQTPLGIRAVAFLSKLGDVKRLGLVEVVFWWKLLLFIFRNQLIFGLTFTLIFTLAA